MKKPELLLIFISLVLFSCHSTQKAKAPAAKKSEASTAERNTQVTLTGTAEQAKMGAILIADDGSVYYIEGKQNWDTEGYYRKKIRITGTIYTRATKPEELVNDKHEYSQGAQDESKYIRMASCELVK